jgi:hypothetical protein
MQGIQPSILEGIVAMTYEVFNVVGDLGAIAIVFWLVIRVTNHTLPRLARTFEEGIRNARADFKVMADQQREDFFKLIEDHREFFARMLKQEHKKIDQIAELLKDKHTCEKEELNGPPNSH